MLPTHATAIQKIEIIGRTIIEAFIKKDIRFLTYPFLRLKPGRNRQFLGLTIPVPQHPQQKEEVYHQLFHFIYDNTVKYLTITEPKIIIDCGASYGITTAKYSRHFPKARIIAFEPNPEAYHHAKKLFRLNKLTNIHLYNQAVSNKENKETIHVHDDHFESSSLIPKPKNQNGKKFQIKTINLSRFIKKEKIYTVDFLKMDIEGAEFAVCDELDKSETIKKISNLFVEVHIDYRKIEEFSLSKIIHILEKNGFYYKIQSTGSEKNTSRFLVWASQKPIVT